MQTPPNRSIAPASSPVAITRRETLKALIAIAAFPGTSLFAQTDKGTAWAETTIRFLQKLRTEEGGFTHSMDTRTHLTPTLAAIGCYQLLGRPVPDHGAVAAFVKSHHPGALKKLEQERRIFDFQQIQALSWLGAGVSDFRDRIAVWKRPLPYLKQYEQHGYPVMQSELSVFPCRALVGLPVEELAPGFGPYIDQRRRANGSYNNTPASEGGDGHVMNTWWALRAVHLLGRSVEEKTSLIEWLKACQLRGGGFTYQPKPEFAGVDDVAYTWAAVRCLALLGSAPAEPTRCIEYLHSLADANGGCGDRIGWAPNPTATYYALDGLHTLKAPLPSPRRGTFRRPMALQRDLKVFSIQLEAHGRGSPAEAVDLAKSLRIHLWGAKNASPGWMRRAQEIANQEKADVTFFQSNEEYGTWVDIPGLGTYSHTSDIIAPADAKIGSTLANRGVVSWPEFRKRRLDPLTAGSGRLIWQFGENEELVRLFLDDSVERGGFAAISTFHFGNPDFTNSEPFLHRWRGRIPFIALQDAHGNEPWWFSDMTTGFRTLFLAQDPTWTGWLKALENNWVAAVRRDAWTAGELWMHAGSTEVQEFVQAREQEWRWWDNPQIERPLISVVVVRPEDEFETARPKDGIVVRVRCAWENNPQGLLKNPIAEFIGLEVDGRETQPKLVTVKAARGNLLADHYHELHLPAASDGKHSVTAQARVLSTRQTIGRTVSFGA